MIIVPLVLAWQINVVAVENLPPSTNPPGGFAPSEMPQIVLLTFDDAVTTSSFELVQQVLTNHFNPNGHAIKATFFVCLNAGYDFYAIRKLYDAGHEIALHTISHQTDTNSTLARWRQEIAGVKRALVSFSGIPAEDITGFRAPRLEINGSAFQVLGERQFRYDSSIREALSGLSTAPTNMIWPYTLDNGLTQNALPSHLPVANYPGLFEIPLWVQFTNTTAVAVTDPPGTLTANEVVALWKTNFLSHYNGNRAPYGVFLHATWSSHWLSDPTNSVARVEALNEFINWASAYSNTWFITCNDLVDFMLDPVCASDAASHPSFQTPERTPFPPSEVIQCSFPNTHTFSTCGVAPPAAIDYRTAYQGLVLKESGVVTFNVISQDLQTAWCVMSVSNNTPDEVYDWTVGFTLGGGTILSHYDTLWTQRWDQVEVNAKSFNHHISPLNGRLLEFRVKRTTGDVTFDAASMNVIGLGPQQIRMDIAPLSDGSELRLSWDDNAYAYQVECSTNLLDSQGWTVITNELCQPELALPRAADDTKRLYLVNRPIIKKKKS